MAEYERLKAMSDEIVAKQKAAARADLIAELRAKVDEIDFTEYHSGVTGLEWIDGFNQALKAVKEVLK